MHFLPYKPEYKTRCIEIFESNQPKFFAEEEKPLFTDWLEHHTQQDYYVVEQEGRLIACGGIFYNASKNEGGLSWGMVHSHHHRQGLGKAFMLYRLRLLKSAYPGAAIRIETSQHTEAFYKKMGFRTEHIIPDGFANGLDKYLMTLQELPGQ